MKGKKVLVTGAGKGIGRGIALAFAKAGADLFLHYRSNPAEAQSLQNEIAALGGKAIVFPFSSAANAIASTLISYSVAA